MAEKYTKQDVVALVDSCYEPCSGSFLCPNYKPVIRHDGVGGYLLSQSISGCCYALELSWGQGNWCGFFPPKGDRNTADRLRSLTWENLVAATKNKTR